MLALDGRSDAASIDIDQKILQLLWISPELCILHLSVQILTYVSFIPIILHSSEVVSFWSQS